MQSWYVDKRKKKHTIQKILTWYLLTTDYILPDTLWSLSKWLNGESLQYFVVGQKLNVG